VTHLLAVLAAIAGGAAHPVADPTPPTRDVTLWLQEKLDAGGEIALPRRRTGAATAPAASGTTMIVDARSNDLRGNRAGRWHFVRLRRGSHLG